MSTTHATALFAPVQDELAAVELRLRETIAGQHCALTAATERLLNAGGKRVRPAICLMTAGVFGADAERSISLAAAVEMVHTATLVHDDLIDVASLRRGIPTLNADWPADAIVLAGDYLFARAAGLVARTRHADVIDLFAQTLMTIVNGEIRQRFFGKGCISRDDYYERIYAKTATMFVLSTQAAAMLGEAAPAAQQALREFGHQVGLAFQIVDDVLDFIGTPDQIGKPVGSDLRQGTFTLPTFYYLEHDARGKTMSDFMSAEMDQLIDAIRRSPAIAAAKAEAQRTAQAARDALAIFPDDLYRRALLDLADYVVERTL
jgi:geranylgeranyl pyrophosphate synthase